MTVQDLTRDQQFQAFAMRRTIDLKVVDSKKMLNDFTVKVLVESLAAVSNERRADLVQKCTGMKRGSALRMSVDDSIKAIELALAEGDTSAEEIFDDKSKPMGISEDEIIRFFPPDRVFNTWFYSGFITAEGEEDQALMADLWDFTIEHKLLGEMTALQLAQALGLHHFVSDKCPIEKRTELMQTILRYGEPLMSSSRPDGSSSSTNADKARAFTGIALFTVVRPADLVKFMRLSDMSKPLEEMAQTKDWIKKVVVETPGESVPPPPDGSDKQPRLTKKEKKRLAEEQRTAKGDDDGPELAVEAADPGDVEDGDDSDEEST